MLIRKKLYFNQKFDYPYHLSGNFPNIITLSYSVEYLTRITFCESVLGGVICRTLTIFHMLGSKSNSKSRLFKQKKNDMRLTADFTWPTIFAARIKTHIYGCSYGKEEKPAIMLTLLVLAFLLRKLCTMGGVAIHYSQKR